jgi:hypothetical protein
VEDGAEAAHRLVAEALEALAEAILAEVELEEIGKKTTHVMNKHPYTLHPWHGVSLGDNVPDECVAFIEIVPTDTIKYEIDKASGLLKVDRPQRFSNIVPALYGFLSARPIVEI